jgi:hypothetical protein
MSTGRLRATVATLIGSSIDFDGLAPAQAAEASVRPRSTDVSITARRSRPVSGIAAVLGAGSIDVSITGRAGRGHDARGPG